MIPPQCSLLAVCSQPCPRVQTPFTSPRAQEHWPRQPFLTHTSEPALSFCLLLLLGTLGLQQSVSSSSPCHSPSIMSNMTLIDGALRRTAPGWASSSCRSAFPPREVLPRSLVLRTTLELLSDQFLCHSRRRRCQD